MNTTLRIRSRLLGVDARLPLPWALRAARGLLITAAAVKVLLFL
ncbi:MAG: hypothetical protein OXH14_03205 [Alphaproteobacteria bacterium]|nr:hypothetical protein [Alphaproteobacteria bacterium]